MARTIKFERSVTDAEAAMARLKAQTRFSMMPYQGSIFTLGSAPLKGRVGRGGFTVALNKRDWLTLLQPTARGRVVRDARGTRVEVTTGISPILLWYLRLAIVFAVPAFVLAFGTVLLLAGAPLFAIAVVCALVLTMLVGVVVGVGINMNNVDGQVDTLAAMVEDALKGAPTSIASDQEVDRLRAASAAAARQKQRT